MKAKNQILVLSFLIFSTFNIKTIPDIKDKEIEQYGTGLINTNSNISKDSLLLKIPPPSIPLLLFKDKDAGYILKHPKKITGNIVSQSYLYDKPRSLDWKYEIINEKLNAICTYELYLSSSDSTNFVIQIFQKHKDTETLIGENSFVVFLSIILPYRGQISLTPLSIPKGDQIVFRITASGSNFSIQTGRYYSSISLLNQANLPKDLFDARNEALLWFLENTHCSFDSNRFLEFNVKLDLVIAIEKSAEWGIGWNNTLNEKPYKLSWLNNSINVKELSQEEANIIGVTEKTFKFKVGYLLANYVVGDQPCAIITNDWNNDGFPDLAVANDSSDNISVLFNNSDGSFQSATTYAVGNSPQSLCSSDLNGDGYSDLAIANSKSNDISILINKGEGTFEPSINYSTGSLPYSIFSSDFDNDGDYDLVTANFGSDNISVLLNKGDGTFGKATNYPVGKEPRSIHSADFDKDNDSDLAIANMGSDSISILFNEGEAKFQKMVNYATRELPYSLYSNDLDNDGDYDLVVVNYGSEYLNLLFNKGDGTFETQKVSIWRTFGTSVYPTDIENDGDYDLVVTRPKGNDITIIINKGDGTFIIRLPVLEVGGRYPCAVISADLNGDGYNDLAVTNMTTNNVTILLNHGDGLF